MTRSREMQRGFCCRATPWAVCDLCWSIGDHMLAKSVVPVPKPLIFLAKNKVFGANGVPKNEPENNEKLEKCAPRVDPFWAPKRTPKLTQKLIQNGPKMKPEFVQFLVSFLGPFWGQNLNGRNCPGLRKCGFTMGKLHFLQK